MTESEALTQEIFDPEDEKYEEEWKVIVNTDGEYVLSKMQARVLQQAIANGDRGIVLFKTFAISIPYITEFFRVRRFLKGAVQLPERATEELYKPIPPERWEEIKKRAYQSIGKTVK